MSNRIMFLDLETNNHHYYGAMASPRHPENFVVMNGYAIEAAPYTGKVEYDHYPTKEAVPAQWLNIPDDVWLLVCHNAPYEMDWFLHLQRPQIKAFLKRGGRIFCTAYAEYLLSHQLKTYPSLDETAPEYGGSHKVDGIKILWEQGVKTKDIDPALLAEYLAGPGGDIENTRKVFYGQYTKLVEQGMWAMALERMEGMIFACFAMDSGLFVNRETAFKQRDAGEAKLAALTAGFAHWRSHIPEYVQFNPGSDFHMSAWLFGGPIKYVGKVYWDNDDGSHRFEKCDCVKHKLPDGKLLWLDADGKLDGLELEVYDFDKAALERYKSGKNKGQIKVFREDTEVRKQKNADLRFNCGPLVDLTLLPQNIYKEFKKEFAGKRTLADNSPVFSTGKDCLDMLALRKEFPEHIQKVLQDLMEWAKIDKDMGTYYLREEKDDDGNVSKQSGMLQYLTPVGIVHHMLNMTATVTTRLSSNRPNFQNLPRGNTSDVKNMFSSRYNDKGWLVYAKQLGLIPPALADDCLRRLDAGLLNGLIGEADYSALEVVTLAAFSKDKELTRSLLEGIDMHCLRLAAQLGEDYLSVLEKCKNQEHPDFKRYDEMRTQIKPKAFSYQYGATAAGIAFSTGCTVEEAQAFIDAEKALFPDVEAWFDDSVFPTVDANTKQFREQTDSGAWRMYGRGHWKSPAGTHYSFRQYEKKLWADGQSTTIMQYKPTQMRNYPIQGESGFFVQGICGKVIRWLIANDFFDGRVFVINTVHDAIYVDCHYTVLDIVGAGIKGIMESLPQHFNTNHGYDLQVPFPAAVEFGRTMKEKLHWHEGMLADEKVRDKFGTAFDPIPELALAA